MVRILHRHECSAVLRSSKLFKRPAMCGPDLGVHGRLKKLHGSPVMWRGVMECKRCPYEHVSSGVYVAAPQAVSLYGRIVVILGRLPGNKWRSCDHLVLCFEEVTGARSAHLVTWRSYRHAITFPRC